VIDDTVFRFFFLLHILSVMVAFAPAVLAVLPGSAEGARATLERAGRTIYAPALVLAGLFGILCLVTSDVGGTRVFDFDQTWVSLAFVVWIAMNGVFHGMVLAGQRQGDGGKVTSGEAIMTVLLLVMLYLMIWKPGL
jgi:hypothetical protein